MYKYDIYNVIKTRIENVKTMCLGVNSGNQLCTIFCLVRHFDDVINWSSRGI